MIGHLRARRRLALLASGVLGGRERAETEAHLLRCPRCRAEHQELCAVVRAMEEDPLRDAEPELPLAVLVGRVEREVERALLTPAARPRWWLVALPAAAAALAATLVVPSLVARLSPPPAPVVAVIPATPPPEAAGPASEEALLRVERALAREQAARYLSEAGEVLVAVSATGSDCDRRNGRLDVGEAPERSRELLEKRQLLVDSGAEAVASAQPVLDDVEQALRDVAELPSCVKRRDVDRLRAELGRRQLLMRIRLMTRELEG